MHSTTLFDTSPAAKKLGKAALSRWKLETLTGLLGYRALMNHQAESEKNQAAENQHIRRSLWGYEGRQSESDDDTMGHTILGDVNHPAPIIMPQQQPQQNPLVSMLLGAAMTAAGGAAGYYFANQNNVTQPTSPPIEFQDETISVGLGKIEDYLKVNE